MWRCWSAWTTRHVESSQVEGDNLRLMQSMLSLRCILLGSFKTADQGSGTQGSVAGPPREFKRQELLPLNSLPLMMTMMLFMLAGLPECTAFRGYDSNNQSSQIEQYSLLDPEPCGNMEKVHAIERELYGEIVQIKKERLVLVTWCTATQTIKSVYCGFQSRSGPERCAKFHDPIVIELADCRQAAKTGRFKLNGKDYPFKMNVRRLVVINLVGGLDNVGNWATFAQAILIAKFTKLSPSSTPLPTSFAVPTVSYFTSHCGGTVCCSASTVASTLPALIPGLYLLLSN